MIRTFQLILLIWAVGVAQVTAGAQDRSLSHLLKHEAQALDKSELIGLQDALTLIENEYGITLVYNSEYVKDQYVSPDFQVRENMELTLKRLLDAHNLTYQQIGGRSLLLIPVANLEPEEIMQETISGVITDAQTGEALPGVNIVIKNTSTGTSSDITGAYEINVPSLSDTLIFSYIGYVTQEIALEGRTELNVEMVMDAIMGEDIVVVGYGEQEEISIVGSVQSIRAPERELRTSSSSLSNSFAGRMAGVIAFQRSGEPGADASQFYIRGISTFSGAINPLIIIDGVQASQGDLNALAPEVIESFSILKDATATAVYGSRGANGVMIVTTKTGQNLDRPLINIRMESAFTSPTSVPEFVSGARYMELYNEAVLGRGTGEIPYSQEKIDGTRAALDPYIYPDVDWYDELFKPVSSNQTLNVNIRGGGQRIGYFMSGTMNHDNGMLRSYDFNTFDNNISVQRYAFQNNLNINVSPTTDVSLRLNTQLRDYSGPGISANQIFGMVMEANPADFPVTFPDDGTTGGVLWGGKDGGRFNDGFRNPFAEMVRGYSSNFQSTVMATVDGRQDLGFITEGLSFHALASFKNWSQTSVTRTRGYNQYQISDYFLEGSGYNYLIEQVGLEQDQTLGTGTGTSGDRNLYLEARLNYTTQLTERQNMSVMLLYNQDDFNVNNPGGLIASLPRRSMGFAGRVSYSFDNRYLAEFNFGYNGSENFAPGKRFGFFPSVALGYVVSGENFWRPLIDTVSLFKIRASWGLVGNDQIGGARFVYLSDINLSGQGFTTGVNQNYSRSGPVYNRFENPNITWEVGEKINVGLDLEFYNQFNLTLDVFQENRRNIFLQRETVPGSFGVAGTSIYGNLGEVRNRGFDLAVDYTGRIGSDLFMSLKGTFTFARNKVLDIDEPPFTQYPNLSLVGHPINTLLGYKAERLFIDEAEIAHHPTQQLGGSVMPGDIMYRDITEDGIITSDDRVRMGHPTVPEIVYGFGPSFNYKSFDFSFLLQGVARTSFFITGFHPFGSSEIRNVLEFIDESHWSRDNPDVFANYPRLSKLNNPNNTSASSYWLRDGSFLKLRNVELGYTYRFARVYLSGLNLLTFSKFNHWDPEMGGGNGLSYPTQRVVNVGIQLSL